jgi:Flp pilus assembly protein TadG
MTAFLLVPLIGFAALAIDYGRLTLIQAELQNAADAAALIGASKLNPTPSGSSDPIWGLAETAARTAIGLNKAERSALTHATATAGYWDITQATNGLQPNTKSPGPNDKPAVQVTVKRAAGLNGGPVALLLAPLIGTNVADVGVVATAVLAPFGGARPGQVFPVAIGKCLYDRYWDSVKNEPKKAASADPLLGTDYPQVVGQPYEFRIPSAYHTDDPCTWGQWTSFQLDANDVTTIRALIENGNPTAFGIGDSIWIQPGTKTALYAAVPVPKDICLPVVLDPDTHDFEPVLAFAAFHISASVGGSSKYIQGHFISDTICGGYGSGPSYGAYAPPRLSQ